MSFNYHAFGLNIVSELELPELPMATVDATWPRVRIFYSSFEENLPDTLRIRASDDCEKFGGAVVQFADNTTQMNITEVAKFRVVNGTEIAIDRDAEAKDEDVRMFLLGSALGILCYQRDLVPLHATAVEFNGEAVAFTGPSGAGKSTLAALFHDLGYPVLCDDICVLSEQDGTVLAWPGHGQFKLTNEAAKHLGHDPTNLPVVATNFEKYHFTNKFTSSKPIPLRKIFALEYHLTSNDSAIEVLRTLSALKTVSQNLYRPRIMEIMGKQSSAFSFAAKVVDQSDVCIFRRTKGLGRFKREAELLSNHLERKAS